MPSATRTDARESGVIGLGFATLWRGIREQPRLFALAASGACLYTLTGVASSIVLGEATERIVLPAVRDGHADWPAVAVAAAVIVGVGALRALGMFVRRLAGGTVVFRVQGHYRHRVTRQYLRLPLSWHQRHSTGTLLSNANADVEAAWNPLMPLPFAVGALIMLVTALALLFATDPVLALIGLVVFPTFGWVNLWYGRRVWPLYAGVQRLRGEVSAVAHESFDGALVVKALGREEEETDRFRVHAEELRDAMIRAGRLRGLFDPLMESLPNLGILLVLIVGAVRIRSGAIDVGQLVRVAYLFTLLAFPLRAFGWVFGDLPRAVVGYQRVEAVLTAPSEEPQGTRNLTGPGPAALRLAAVSYAYPDASPDGTAALPGTAAPAGTASPDGASQDDAAGPSARSERPVLSEVSVEVAPGSIVAITGRTGAGKSTLAGMLARLVDPTDGAVLLDGVDLRDLAPGEVSRAVALVPQQAFLFDDTVRANITLGLDVSTEAVWAALRSAQADRFVAALPAGLDTHVGERGTSLSGGQRQRVCLARALVRAPRLLVLDDATASVDPRVEGAILAGLRENAGASTVVVVAQRRSTIALADEVVHLDAGRVIGCGRHVDLLASSPRYAALLTAYEQAARAAGTDAMPDPDLATEAVS
ncbi:ABC transporter ATP-binding protein/permease [Frankia sp. AgB32]|nr:ABC transporter ATP-binding protein/permease [Frankia sp. AgB32]